MSQDFIPRLSVRLLLSLVAFIALSQASIASAVVNESDWTATSSLDEATDDNNETTINLTECKDEVADSSQTVDVTFAVSTGNTPSSTAKYALKVAVGSESCNRDSLTSEAEDECETLISDSPLTLTTFTETIDFTKLISITSEAECEGLSETSYVYLIVEEVDTTGLDTLIYDVAYQIVFNAVRPDTPTGVTATAGETTIDVSWSEVTDVDNYRVYYSTENIDVSVAPEDQPSSVSSTATTAQTSLSISGVSVESVYNVAVASIDSDGNESFLSEAATAETVPVDDFWESYSRENPDVESGFCFIATAAYGSYQAPHVRILRQFRDQFLLTNAPGRVFVDLYYTYSPPVARLIASSETARAVTRVLLLPLYGVALVLVNRSLMPLGAALGFVLGLLLLLHVRRRDRRARSVIARLPAPSRRGWRPVATAAGAAIVMLALLLPAADAFAQSEEFNESPVNMMLEIKAGPYAPEGLGGTYDTYFADDTPVLFEIEYDWQFYRGIGSAGLGASIAYGAADGNGITQDGTSSVDPTALSLLPLRFHLIYRFDYLAVELDIPFTIYAKLGLDYYVWWVTDGGGDTATNDGGANGSGGTFGWHVVGGLAFLLDWLAPTMARGFDLEWGVNNSYLFAELLYADISGFGSSASLDLTALTFQLGLALEF